MQCGRALSMLLLTAILALLAMRAAAAEEARIDYPSQAPAGLVGNGVSIVQVSPLGFEFVSGGTASGELRLFVGGKALALSDAPVSASFFPGGVAYRLKLGSTVVEIVRGALPAVRYLIGVHVQNASGPVDFEIAGRGEPALSPAARRSVPLTRGAGFVTASTDAMPAARSWEALRVILEPGLDSHTALMVSWPTRERPVEVTVDGQPRLDFTAAGIRLDRPFRELIARW